MKLRATIVSAIVVLATPVIVWLVASSATPRPGEPDATLVVAVALVAGLCLGTAYQLVKLLWRHRLRGDCGNPSSGKGGLRLGIWGAMSAGALALILKAAFPEVFGLSLALVAPMFGAGLFAPGLGGHVVRVIREESALGKRKSS